MTGRPHIPRTPCPETFEFQPEGLRLGEVVLTCGLTRGHTGQHTVRVVGAGKTAALTWPVDSEDT